MEYKIMSASKVSVKELKSYLTQDNYPVYSGSFYFENKKVGIFQEDDWGGTFSFQFEDDEIKKEVEADILESLTSLGFRSLSSSTCTPVMSDIEEYLTLIITTKTFVDSLKNAQRKKFIYAKKTRKVDFFPNNEFFKSYILIKPITHTIVPYSDKNKYFFNFRKESCCIIPLAIDINSIKSITKNVDFFVSINTHGVMDRLD